MSSGIGRACRENQLQPTGRCLNRVAVSLPAYMYSPRTTVIGRRLVVAKEGENLEMINFSIKSLAVSQIGQGRRMLSYKYRLKIMTCAVLIARLC